MPSDRPILTAAEMRAAEQAVIDGGTSVETLMEQAGAAAAEAIWLYAEPQQTLFLCGPGNNGGDGYVIARHLRARGVTVRVAALGGPQSDGARWARSQWNGDVESLADAEPAPLIVDALFGTGLGRPLEPAAASALLRLAEAARIQIAIDLPSGAATDDGSLLSPVPDYDLTVTFGALKPSHLLQPAARHMGRLVVADINVPVRSKLHIVSKPLLSVPGPDDHKYSRGYVVVMAGEMPGASALAATASARAGAGYVRLIADAPVPGIPQAVVQAPSGSADLADSRIGALVAGPGLGREKGSWEKLQRALDAHCPLVLDADALFFLSGELDRLHGLPHLPILTPHAGEFERLFGSLEGSRVEQARAAAGRARAVIVFKGPDTVIAAPDGRAAIARPASPYLASAGTGDVLAGMVAAMRARGLEAFEAACAAVWLHSRAAKALGPGSVADDLVAAIPSALAECR